MSGTKVILPSNGNKHKIEKGLAPAFYVQNVSRAEVYWSFSEVGDVGIMMKDGETNFYDLDVWFWTKAGNTNTGIIVMRRP